MKKNTGMFLCSSCIKIMIQTKIPKIFVLNQEKVVLQKNLFFFAIHFFLPFFFPIFGSPKMLGQQVHRLGHALGQVHGGHAPRLRHGDLGPGLQLQDVPRWPGSVSMAMFGQVFSRAKRQKNGQEKKTRGK